MNKSNQHLRDGIIKTYQLEQTLGLLGDPSGVVGGVRPDGLKQFVLIVTLER